MRIAHVADYYDPELSGSLNDYTIQLAKRGHDITIYTSKYALFGPLKSAPESIRVKRYGGKKIGNFVLFPSVVKDLIVDKNDIIQSYTIGFFSTTACGYLRAVKSTPLVVIGDFNIFEKRRLLKAPYNFFWKQLPLKTADVITASTGFMKTALQNRFHVKPEKIEILPIGIDFKKFKGRTGGGKFKILTVGRLHRVKNIEMIIRALPALRDNGIDFTLSIVGFVQDRGYYNELRNLAKTLGVGNRVKFVGKIPHAEVLKYYSSSDVYIQSSKFESFCLATLEAMAAGLPVMATKTGAIGWEYLDKYDYWISTPEELSRKLIELYGSKAKRLALGRELRAIARQYDWKNVIKTLEKIYEKAMG